MDNSIAKLVIGTLAVLLADHAVAETVIEANFACQTGKTIAATFQDTFVELKLSDGRSVTLSQVMSASEARYATANKSLIFWNKGETAFIPKVRLTKPIPAVS